MKVHEFIDWLKTQEPDAEVLVVFHTSGRGYYEQGGTVEQVVFDSTPASADNNWTEHFNSYTDSKGNSTLLIGSTGN